MKWKSFVALVEQYRKVREIPEDGKLHAVFHFRDGREMVVGPISFWERGESLLVLDGTWRDTVKKPTRVITRWEEINSVSLYDTWPLAEAPGSETIGFKVHHVT
jgi:hypothetical protein